jgi:putative oxidoreductase
MNHTIVRADFSAFSFAFYDLCAFALNRRQNQPATRATPAVLHECCAKIPVCPGPIDKVYEPMSKSDSCCEKWSPYLLSLLRVVIAVLFMCHGGQKLLGYPAATQGTVPPFSLPGISGILELFGGLFVLLGLFTRPVAFILSGEMAVAYFMVHFRQGWWPIQNKGELAVIYSFAFLYLSAAGAGPLSLDALRKPRQPDHEG